MGKRGRPSKAADIATANRYKAYLAEIKTREKIPLPSVCARCGGRMFQSEDDAVCINCGECVSNVVERYSHG